MKKILSLILLCLLIMSVVLCGCSETESNDCIQDYVSLADYSNLDISPEEYSVADDELELAVELNLAEMNVLEIVDDAATEGDIVELKISDEETVENISVELGLDEYEEGLDEKLIGKKATETFEIEMSSKKYSIEIISVERQATKLTDDIAKEYFDCNDAITATENIKREIVENRFFETARDYILENSIITGFPADSDEYVDNIVSESELQAESLGIDYEEYLETNYQMTESEYREAVLLGFADYMILKAFSEETGYTISENSRNEIVSEIADTDDISNEEALELYGQEYFDYILYEENMKSVILQLYNEEIEDAI